MGIIAVYDSIKGVIMLKFKFNYLHNTLSIHQENNLWSQIAEGKQFTTEYGNLGFKLSPGWITFTLYENKIRAFYKHFDTPSWITYYRKDLPKECPLIFTFTEQDEVEKVNGKWTKKGGNHA